MTGAEIMAAVGFMVMLFGAITTAFWRMWGLIKDAADKGDKAQRDLAEYKTQVATTYATKEGVQQQTQDLLRAIDGVARRIDGLNERLDNILIQTSPRTS